jgi:hypothetical protein
LPAPAEITLCLNAVSETGISCQKYTVTKSNLSITTTIPNKTYTAAGLKIDTPDFSFSIPVGSNGYSALGTISSTQAATGTITSSAGLTFTNLYAENTDSLATYSVNNGSDWGYMLSPQTGWYWNYTTT